MPVSVVAEDPILAGLGRAPAFLEMHYCEAKEVPPGFHLLASTADCRVQLMKRDDKPVYGTQFHPEGYTEWPYDERSELVNLIYPEGLLGRAAGRAQAAGELLPRRWRDVIGADDVLL